MPQPSPYCPRCKGTGHYLAPYYSNWKVEMCEVSCGCVDESHKTECMLLTIGFVIMLIAFYKYYFLTQ